MFYIVETKEQLDRLAVYKDDDCFVHNIHHSEGNHMLYDQISVIYYRPFSASSGFLICRNHSESMSIHDVSTFIDNLTGQIWCIDSKSILRFWSVFLSPNSLKLAYALSGKEFPDLSSCDTAAHRHLNSTCHGNRDINVMIPLSKHYEKWETVYSILDFGLNPSGYDFYNDVVFNSFWMLEKQPIRGDGPEITKYFPKYDNYLIGSSSFVMSYLFTSYDLCHSTARPSCNYSGINYMALPKANGARKIISSDPENYLVEFDYKSYQIKLLADLIGYTFDSGNIHRELAKQYFNTDIVTDEQYEEGKKLTFRYSYGRTTEAPDIPFFQQVYTLRDELWSFNEENGFIISPISGRHLFGITKLTQVLPHLMQCLETERNALVLQNIHKFLEGKRSHIILYQYDSFLFDIHYREGTALVGQIKDILEEDGYETTVSFGYNYHEMNKTIIS